MTETPAPAGSGKSAATAAMIGGTPLGIFSLMLWESYHPGQTLNEYQACAIGSVGAAVFAYLWHAITLVIDAALNRLK
jgi:hypothetical protein